MEHAIHKPGEHLAALQKIITVDVRVALNQLPSPDAAQLDSISTSLDECVGRLRYELFTEYHVYADAPAQARYVASRQYTLLELIGHLLEYTQPFQLYSTLSRRTSTDDICKHIYRRLDSLLNYTVVSLATGQIHRGLPLPPAAHILYQHMLGSNLVALRDRFVALHVSPRLIDIVLEPFEELRHADYITFYHAVYLRELKQKLQALAGGKQQSPGDGDVLRLLVAHNFNEPALVTYCREVMEGQLETCTSPEARVRRLHEYQIRLAGLSYSSGLAWHPHPHPPSVRQQLTAWLDVVIATPAHVMRTKSVLTAPQTEPEEEYDDMPAAGDFMLHLHPTIFGAIANAAHERKIIHLGNTDQQRAERLSGIPSSVKRVAPETIRRGFTKVEVCRRGLVYVDNIGEQLRDTIKKYETKSSR